METEPLIAVICTRCLADYFIYKCDLDDEPCPFMCPECHFEVDG